MVKHGLAHQLTYEEACARIDRAAELGLMVGVSETEFRPDAPITREQMATFLLRFANCYGYVFEIDDVNGTIDGEASYITVLAQTYKNFQDNCGFRNEYKNYVSKLTKLSSVLHFESVEATPSTEAAA